MTLQQGVFDNVLTPASGKGGSATTPILSFRTPAARPAGLEGRIRALIV